MLETRSLSRKHLRQAFQVREGDTFKAHPCLFRYRVDPTFPWTLDGVVERKKADAMCPSDAASATAPDALEVLDVPCEVRLVRGCVCLRARHPGARVCVCLAMRV